MSWYSWVAVLLCLGSAAASPLVVGEPRTRGQMFWNVPTLLFFVWVVLKLETLGGAA